MGCTKFRSETIMRTVQARSALCVRLIGSLAGFQPTVTHLHSPDALEPSLCIRTLSRQTQLKCNLRGLCSEMADVAPELNETQGVYRGDSGMLGQVTIHSGPRRSYHHVSGQRPRVVSARTAFQLFDVTGLNGEACDTVSCSRTWGISGSIKFCRQVRGPQLFTAHFAP